MLNPRIVGTWDARHVWLQWDPQPGVASYEVRLRFSADGSNWTEWVDRFMVQKAWCARNLQYRKPGSYVQAEVAGGSGWERAIGAAFVRSRCKFKITSERREIFYPKGSTFHAVVDGAACSYKSLEDVEAQPGETVETEMAALSSGPWSQIDNPFDFKLRAGLGVTVTNIEPSENDLQPLGVDFAQLMIAKRDGPIALVRL